MLLPRFRYGAIAPWDSPTAGKHATGMFSDPPFESHHPQQQIEKTDTLRYRFFYGGGDGTRTHNARNHNPVLCQLNYTHHILLC